MSIIHHILLLGGTGSCGQLFIRTVLDQGHRLTLYARSPSKLSPDLAAHPNIEIIEGTYEDVAGLSRAASCGADTFISLAGPTMGKRNGTPITETLRRLYPLLLKTNPRVRILVLSTASYSAREDQRSIKWFFAINGYVRIIGGDAYNEIRGIASETVALGQDVEWTVFRVPLLHGSEVSSTDKLFGDEPFKPDSHPQATNERRARVHAAFVGEYNDGLWLERGRLANWILGEIDEKRWVRSCPLLSNA